MASLRDAIKEQQEELQGGNAWVAFWKEGRSWHSEAFHLDMGATLYPEDEWRLREIEAADPAAIVLNGYLSEDMTLDEEIEAADPAAIVLNGYLSEDMTLDELTTSIRYHYEHRMNGITGFITEYSDRLSPEEIEKGRAAAHAAGLPFSEKPFRDGEDFDPYVYNGSMSMEDYELMQRMIENERSERMDEPILSGYLSNLGAYTEGRPAGEWVTFPTTAGHMKEVFDRIGIDFKNYGEWHFTEFQSPIPGLAAKLGKHEHPDELNYLGTLLEISTLHRTLTATGFTRPSTMRKNTGITLLMNWKNRSCRRKPKNISCMRNTGGTRLSLTGAHLQNGATSTTTGTRLQGGMTGGTYRRNTG